MGRDRCLITVVVPITELRGGVDDHLRSWTHAQTLERDRYRIVAVHNGEYGALDSEVRSLLAPQDELVLVPQANTPALLNAGASRAETPWIVFTEGHSLAEPGCLSALARWIEDNPQSSAGNFELHHLAESLLDRLSTEWYDNILEQWRRPESWPRLIPGGCAIRASLFAELGPLQPQYDLLALPLLSARLHERGISLGSIPNASTVHVDTQTMASHHDSTARYVMNEFDARRDLDPAYMERFFGHVPLWTNQFGRRRQAAWAMLRAFPAAASDARRLAPLMPELVRQLRTVAVGETLPVLLAAMVVKARELALERIPLPARLQKTMFERAHANMVHLTRLRWIRRNLPAAPRPRGALVGRRCAGEMAPDHAVGLHAVETHKGHVFRWSEPVFTLRGIVPDHPCDLHVETGAIRGDPLTSLIAVVAGGRRLPADLVSSPDQSGLVISLPAPWHQHAAASMTFLCDPLRPAGANLNARRLGLPLVSISSIPHAPLWVGGTR